MAEVVGSEEQFMGEANGAAPTATLGPPPIMGPSITPTLGPVGLRGRARFDDLLMRMRGMTYQNQWDTDFNTWILSEKEDPSDPEYNSMLRWAKNNAKMKQEGTEKGITGPEVAPPDGDGPDLPLQQGGQAAVVEELGVKPARLPTDEDIADEKKYARLYEGEKTAYGQTLFKGTPTSESSLATPTGESNILAQFMSLNGKALTGSQGEMAKRSGYFVYMGTESTTGKTGVFKRDIYMYVKDASSGLVAQGPSKIKEYQKKLGLPVSGVDDGRLTGLWKDAVRQAQEYAQAGIKMSVQEIFDNMVTNAQASRGGGGGGGGGSGFIGDTPEDIAAIDYYRAMMQILGDISGVPTPGGRG